MYGRDPYGRVVYGRILAQGELVTLAGVSARVRMGGRIPAHEVEAHTDYARVVSKSSRLLPAYASGAKVSIRSRNSAPIVTQGLDSATVRVRPSAIVLEPEVKGSNARIRCVAGSVSTQTTIEGRNARVTFKGNSQLAVVAPRQKTTVWYRGRPASTASDILLDKATIKVGKGQSSTLISQDLGKATIFVRPQTLNLEPEIRASEARVGIRSQFSISTFMSFEGSEAKVFVRGQAPRVQPRVAVTIFD